MPDALDRYIALAESQGSRARTARGILCAVKEGRVRLCPDPERPRRSFLEAEARARADEHCRGRALAAARAAGYAGECADIYGAILLAGVPAEVAGRVLRDVLSWCRMHLGMQGQHPVVLTAGDRLREAGTGYYFRWRSTAPGSYQPSTRRAEVGIEYLRDIVRRGLVRHRGPGGGIYVAEPDYQRLGWSVHRGLTREGRILVVRGPDGYIYHARPSRSPAEAIRVAVRAYRGRRLALVPREALVSRAAHIWVSREDSVRAGHCEIGTEQAAKQIERALGAEGPLGAVRGDVLLDIRRGDDYAFRALAAAARRADPKALAI
jgi:hypothetical protein